MGTKVCVHFHLVLIDPRPDCHTNILSPYVLPAIWINMMAARSQRPWLWRKLLIAERIPWRKKMKTVQATTDQLVMGADCIQVLGMFLEDLVRKGVLQSLCQLSSLPLFGQVVILSSIQALWLETLTLLFVHTNMINKNNDSCLDFWCCIAQSTDRRKNMQRVAVKGRQFYHWLFHLSVSSIRSWQATQHLWSEQGS